MAKKEARRCIDCGADISSLHYNAKRCAACGKKRKQEKDLTRLKAKQQRSVKWLSFEENPTTNELSHRSAKGSRLRYWLDRICKELSIQELDFLLLVWDWRIRDPQVPKTRKREYRTCAGIVRDWRDYNVLKQVFNSVSFSAETGVIFNTDGTYLTVDFDEEHDDYIVRNSEGTVICHY